MLSLLLKGCSFLFFLLMARRTVAIVTLMPSPYQVELFDRLCAEGRVDPKVIYLQRKFPGLLWDVPRFRHAHIFCEDGQTAEATGRQWIGGADLAVFAWYFNRHAQALMRRRAASTQPWCMWGEPPGAKRGGFVGYVCRRMLLAPLACGRAPIWGIGSWAVEAWRREFGDCRSYYNVPYVSDLNRFRAANGVRARVPGQRRILCCGFLIPRKGVDVLARAYASAATDYPGLRLDFLGTGPLEKGLRTMLAGFGERVRFLGFHQWDSVPRVYHSADVLCQPSRYDGWGIVVIEGLAAGLPVVSTDKTGACIESIQHEVNGWRLPAGDDSALEGTLRAIAQMEDAQLSTMSQAAAATANIFSLDAGVDRFCTAVEQTIAQWRR